MFSPHHVEALVHERQRELLQTADGIRQGRRHRRAARAGRGRRLRVRLASVVHHLAAKLPAWPRRRSSTAPAPAPAVTATGTGTGTADAADGPPPAPPRTALTSVPAARRRRHHHSPSHVPGAA